jgi:hypothetical protein
MVCLGWSPLFRPFRASAPLRPSVSQGVALGYDVSAPVGRMFLVLLSRAAGFFDRPSYGKEVLRSQGSRSDTAVHGPVSGSVGFSRTITVEPGELSFPDQFRVRFRDFVEVF